MPKRTNDFQNLVASIYQKIVPSGGAVTESGMVWDRDAGELREVDILVESNVAGHDFKIMVECRDRSRKESVEWIDGLIGKSRSLNVNKVVAISSKGFAKPAIEKARANGIDTLTPRQAQETDWQNYPIKPSVVVFSDEALTLQDVQYIRDGEFVSLAELGLETNVYFDNQEVGSIQSVFERTFLDFLVPDINAYLKDHIGELFKTREDLDKPLVVELERNLSELTIIESEGKPVDLSRVKFLIQGVRAVTNLDQKHTVFNGVIVSEGWHQNEDQTKLISRVIQEPGSKTVRFQVLKK